MISFASSADDLDDDGGAVDSLHSAATDLVRGTAARIDQFFVTEDHATFIDNETRVRLRFDVDHIENHGFETSARIKLHLVLPGLNDRLRLVVNDDDGPDGEGTAHTTDDDNNLAMRWIGKQSDTTSINFDLGLRIKEGHVDPFVRINTGFRYPIAGEWLGQSSNRLYYYSRTGFRDDFRQYFDRPFANDMLFRSRTRVQYFEENVSNPNIEQKFSLFQTLTDKSAIAYEVLWQRESEEDSVFDDDEILIPLRDDYQQVQLRLRYRRQFWRDWLFFEFWPIVAWAEERDWGSVLGARARIEINLGSKGDLRLDE